MAPTSTPLTEEARIGRPAAGALAIVFCAILVVPSVHQMAFELGRTGRWRVTALFQEPPTRDSLKRFEESLERDSELAESLRERYQGLLTCGLGLGNEKIVRGRDGFLFFRKEVDMVTGPGFLQRRAPARRGTSGETRERKGSDRVGVIARYGQELRARGIHLVFVPVPIKTFIYPEKVWPGYPVLSGPAGNVDREAFFVNLRAAGVDVLDLAGALWKAKREGEVFLKLDTHWTPRGLGVAADLIAAHVRPLAGPGRVECPSETRIVTHGGDLLRMIDLPPEGACFPLESVEIHPVSLQGDDASTVLLLGDSFTNVYSRRELEWGERAGLGEQLMLRLGIPVQILALNGGGATAVRELLAQKPGMLRHKNLVIWACSSRDLFDETISWDPVPLPDP
jgi:hypothetical protein